MGLSGAGSLGRSSIKHPHHNQFSLCCRSFLPENKIGKTALIYFSRMNKDMTVTGVMKRWEPIIHISHTPRWSRLSRSNNLSLFSSSVAEESWLPWLGGGHEGLSRRETRSRGGRRRVFEHSLALPFFVRGRYFYLYSSNCPSLRLRALLL